MIVHNDFIPLGDNSNYDLTREKPSSYSSDIFSKLQFEDLKNAHVETVIPVTDEDLLNRTQYSNVVELKNARNADSTVPLNNNQVKQFLREQEEKNMQIGSNVAFKISEANTRIYKN